MRDAERFEVRDNLGGLVEIEICGELKPIGGKGASGRHANLRDASALPRAGGGRRLHCPRSVCLRSRWNA